MQSFINTKNQDVIRRLFEVPILTSSVLMLCIGQINSINVYNRLVNRLVSYAVSACR